MYQPARTRHRLTGTFVHGKTMFGKERRALDIIDAGWSSPVARQAHNLKVVGSNPTPATNYFKDLAEMLGPYFLPQGQYRGTSKRKTNLRVISGD